MKKFIFMFFLFLSFFNSGCLLKSSENQIPITPSPFNSCSTIYVLSNCKECSGIIIINDFNTGIYLAPWGGTFLNIPGINCGDLVRVNILNKADILSHTEARTAIAPQTIFQFDWFKYEKN